ncbi:response regulator transcription factor [Pusillimonas sp. CC-YST705]|uniref:Response regulator transcription factor n=1 Tax=Mesopusillimonas faecipullorum TaxID=2755040 RepID=A0ABS8CBK2_9BURK|nr:response regulator transcription factor [Mesopusillimonas faecipullorum]MCB5363412.1 response regulator transcription factor [Mesopusillimonas faecipullorum]
MKLLVIEDHPSLRALLVEHLQHQGFAVDAVMSGQDALAAQRTTQYDAMILDLGLPDMDGLRVLEQRACGHHGPLPCIVLTARDAVESRISSLNAGADDYMLKPFDIRELEARVRAVLRRASRSTATLTCGNLHFEPQSRHACVDGNMLDLSRRETMLLEALLLASPRIVVKEFLEEQLYTSSESVTLNAIEALVSRLRRKLSTSGAQASIHTVRGIGYRLAPVSAHATND